MDLRYKRFWITVEDVVSSEENQSPEPLNLFRYSYGFLNMTYESVTLAIV